MVAKYFVYLIFNFSFFVQADVSNEEMARKRLLKIGIEKVAFERLDYQKHTFDFTLKEKMSAYGAEFPAGTDVYVEQITNFTTKKTTDHIVQATPPKNKSMAFQGANCTRLEFDQKDLIQCALAEDTLYKGILFPKGTQLHYDRALKKDNVAVPVLFSNLKKATILNGKEYPAFNGAVRITETGELTDKGASELLQKIHKMHDK